MPRAVSSAFHRRRTEQIDPLERLDLLHRRFERVRAVISQNVRMDEQRARAVDAPGEGRSRAHKRILVTILALALLAFAVGRWLDPDPRGYGTHEQLWLPPCRAMSVFGIPCPVCGVTTALSLAAHGRWLDSFATQPFGCVLALALFALALAALAAHLAGRDLGRLATALARRRARMTAAIVGIGLAAWIYKLFVVLA
jgi:hypothetical protein